MSAFYVIQDHPVHIPRGQQLVSSALVRLVGRSDEGAWYLLAEDGGCHELSDGKPTRTAGSAATEDRKRRGSMNDGERRPSDP